MTNCGRFFSLTLEFFNQDLLFYYYCNVLFLKLWKEDAIADFTLLFQKFNIVYPQLSNFGSEAELNDVKEAIQQLLRWGWKYNKNLEEQAAQLHMLTGWSQVVEVHIFLCSRF